MMPSRKAPKLASQNPPGIVTVVLAYPVPMSTAIGSAADAHPQAPPATSTTSSTSVLRLTPATVIDRVVAASVSWVSTNLSLKAGLPELRRVDAVVVCAMLTRSRVVRTDLGTARSMAGCSQRSRRTSGRRAIPPLRLTPVGGMKRQWLAEHNVPGGRAAGTWVTRPSSASGGAT